MDADQREELRKVYEYIGPGMYTVNQICNMLDLSEDEVWKYIHKNYTDTYQYDRAEATNNYCNETKCCEEQAMVSDKFYRPRLDYRFIEDEVTKAESLLNEGQMMQRRSYDMLVCICRDLINKVSMED
jgi:hypothetical protein